VFWSIASSRNEWVQFATRGGSPAFSTPQPVFPEGKAQQIQLFGATADGARYLALRRQNTGIGSNLYLIVNWQDLLSAD